MSSAPISARCNKCSHIYEEMWVTRNHQGNLSLEGAVCQECNGRNTLVRHWATSMASPLIQPAENGEINRFEYSYRDDSGKVHNKKLDPKSVSKHAQKHS